MVETSVNKLNKFESWILASRPKTLLASAVPVIVGSALAYYDGGFKLIASLLALTCSFFIQIGTNLVNDLYDFLSGADRKERHGPSRAAATGLLTTREIKIGIWFTFGTAFLAGLYLVHLGGWIILLIGILSIIAGFLYTAGPFPFAYHALGDIAVFIFFGFVGTIGTYYVQTLNITPFAFWVSVPVGALITNILVVNNYRDWAEDRSVGKITLAVKFGKKFTRLQYVFFMIISYCIPLIVFFTFKQTVWIFLPLLSLPIALRLIKMIYTLEGRELNKTLEMTSKLSGMYGLLFAVGILL